MAETPRLSLPFLIVGQAQKEFTHNESLQTLDMLVSGSVEEPPLTTPPPSPVLGAAYIVADGATGDWAGKSPSVAAWTSGGWRFVAPVDGMSLYERSSGTWAIYRNGGWEVGNLRGAAVVIGGVQVVGPRAAAVSPPSGGSVVDSEARGTIEAILGALREHGLIDS
jgi:Protein of unknown function (DUF2793)